MNVIQICIIYLPTIRRLFDCVYRNKIIECLVQYKFPAKLIRLLELNLINTRARIKISDEYAEEFVKWNLE